MIDKNLIKQFKERRKAIPNAKLTLRDFIRLYNFVEKELSKRGIDIKQFDILSEIDMSLDYWENRENLKKKFGIAFSEDVKSNIEKWKEKQIRYIEEITKQEEEEIKNRIVNGADVDIIRYFEDIEKMIKVLINSDEKKGLIILGAKGLGKTYSTIYFLKKLGIKYDMVRGHISPIALFNVISRNSENVILFDDCLTLFKDDKKVGFILNALDEIGIVDYRTYNMIGGTITNKFVFKGKMIFIFNEFNDRNITLKALRDRCFTLSLNFKRKEILEMLYTLAKKDNLIFLVDWLKDRKIELSLRDYLTLKAIYKVVSENWQSLAEKVIDNEIDRETNEIDRLILKINEENPDKSNNEKARIFSNITGMDRRTYYRHLKKLRGLGLL
jgi:DNA-binding transcriptional ArsR family regulator